MTIMAVLAYIASKFSALTPRQALTPTPYALHAAALTATSAGSVVAGGAGDTIAGVRSSFIAGGAWNVFHTISGWRAIGGGSDNLIGSNSFNGVILGG